MERRCHVWTPKGNRQSQGPCDHLLRLLVSCCRYPPPPHQQKDYETLAKMRPAPASRVTYGLTRSCAMCLKVNLRNSPSTVDSSPSFYWKSLLKPPALPWRPAVPSLRSHRPLRGWRHHTQHVGASLLPTCLPHRERRPWVLSTYSRATERGTRRGH